MPRCLQVRMIRTAISPRLAIRIRCIAVRSASLAHTQQDLAVFDETPIGCKDLGNRARTPARTVFINFMTSMMPTIESASTCDPTSTKGRRTGLGRPIKCAQHG